MRSLTGRRLLLRVLRRLPLLRAFGAGPVTALSFALSYFLHPQKGRARRERLRRLAARRAGRRRGADPVAEEDLARATVEQVA